MGPPLDEPTPAQAEPLRPLINERAVNMRRRAEAAEARCAELERELQKANDRLVEHKQMNRSLNEVCQKFEARVAELKTHNEQCGDRFVAAEARAAECDALLAQATLKRLHAEAAREAAKARVAELERLFQQTQGCHHSWVARCVFLEECWNDAEARCEELERLSESHDKTLHEVLA